ncbi:uncharacterized protein LOC144906905 [Branchiostoma floridae x Branchiostoma belcheri]
MGMILNPRMLIIFKLLILHGSSSEKIICEPCPPGTHMTEECLEEHPTVCEPCPEGSYMPTENKAKGCFPHPKCGYGERTRFRGNATHPRTCTCRQGYYSRGQGCDRNVYCPPGEGINKKGDGCRRCPEGTYSDQLSNLQRCRPCTNCAKLGGRTVSLCTSVRNVVCERLRHSADIEGRTLKTNDDSELRFAIQETEDSEETLTDTTSPNLTSIVLISIAVSGTITCSGVLALVFYSRRYYKMALEPREDNCVCQAPPIIEGPIPGPVQCEEQTLPKQREALQPPDQPPAYSENCSECDDLQETSSSRDPLLPSEEQETNSDSSVPETNTDSGITDDVSLSTTLSTTARDQDQSSPPDSYDEDHSNLEDMAMSASMRGSTSSIASTASTMASSRATSASSLEYRHKVQEALSRAYSNVLTRSAMEQLANELGQDWKYVARRLGLKEYEIDHILNEHRSNIQEQTFAMIRNWQQGKAGGATISELYGALLDCNRGELCSKLQSLAAN